MGRWSGRSISLTGTEVRAKKRFTSVILEGAAFNSFAGYGSAGLMPLYFRSQVPRRYPTLPKTISLTEIPCYNRIVVTTRHGIRHCAA